MRRTLAGLLFGIAYACASVAFGGFLLQRTAFNPDRTADSARTVLEDPAIRGQVIDLVANATSSKLGVPAADVKTGILDLLDDPRYAAAMSREMAEILHDAHAHLIGQQDEPVQITAQQMRNIVRKDVVSSLPPVELPVPKVTALAVARDVLRWLVPIAAIAALFFALIGLTAHPERAALLRSLGFGLFLLAALVVVLGYLVPRFAVPALSDSPWANAPARLADDNLPVIVALAVVLVAGGGALLMGSGVIRRRRRWSAPVSTYRYNEERRWT